MTWKKEGWAIYTLTPSPWVSGSLGQGCPGTEPVWRSWKYDGHRGDTAEVAQNCPPPWPRKSEVGC